jgi:tRNA(Arg) A34 adenosine deaminase TadA
MEVAARGTRGARVRIEIEWPEWVAEVTDPVQRLASQEERMQLVVRLSDLNVRHRTGGPFAAAVFDRRDHRLVAAGTNLVTQSGYAVAHAEVLALSLAQRVRGVFDLASAGGDYELVSSAEPCAMCLGASCWSGITALSCGARSEDVEAIGFDEGPKPADWVAALTARQIEVTRDVLRDEAVAVLARYRDAGGVIYNGRG